MPGFSIPRYIFKSAATFTNIRAFICSEVVLIVRIAGILNSKFTRLVLAELVHESAIGDEVVLPFLEQTSKYVCATAAAAAASRSQWGCMSVYFKLSGCRVVITVLVRLSHTRPRVRVVAGTTFAARGARVRGSLRTVEAIRVFAKRLRVASAGAAALATAAGTSCIVRATEEKDYNQRLHSCCIHARSRSKQRYVVNAAHCTRRRGPPTKLKLLFGE